MKLEYCMYILDVAELGSIRQAAEKRYITQQGLSAAICSVEKELGVDIFCRAGNRLHITSAGQSVIEKMRKLVEDYQELLIDVSSQGQMENDPYAGTLNILYTSTVGAMYCSPVLSKLLKRYPRVHLRMYDIVADELMSTEFDENTIAIVGMPAFMADEIMAYGHEKMAYHRLVQNRLMCTVSVKSPFASMEKVTVEDFCKTPFAIFDTEEKMLHQLMGDCYDVDIAFKGNDYSLFRDVVAGTQVMGFTTQLNEVYFKRPNMVQIPFVPSDEVPGIFIDYGCVTKPGKVSPLVTECLNIVRDELSKYNTD